MISRIYGLTGGVGMGKTAAGRLLNTLGVQSTDSDGLARKVVEPGQPALDEIKNNFGEEVLDYQGRLDRSKMASIIFGDEVQRRRLEDIIHPRVKELRVKQVAEWRADNVGVGIVIIPLLYEVKAEVEFDKIICIACAPNTQFKRLRDRGWSDDQIKARVSAQMDISEKMDRSDHLVWNEGMKSVMCEQLKQIIA
ncbi:MAG: dephospho-CoA kinase [Verrucomicrobiota bacterium]|nr:dephospho-CoA kinase [Verrucomicrobiota bacterium]